jgi:hypothetical protein
MAKVKNKLGSAEGDTLIVTTQRDLRYAINEVWRVEDAEFDMLLEMLRDAQKRMDDKIYSKIQDKHIQTSKSPGASLTGRILFLVY